MGPDKIFRKLAAALGLLPTLVLPLAATAAPSLPGAAVVTILEGDATVLRDTGRFPAAEGLRLRADDIVSTGTAARLLRIEFDDGKTLDLGPSTQLMLLPRPLAREAAATPTAYVLHGWVKLTVPAKSGSPGLLASPRVDVAHVAGTLIARLAPEQAWLFAESGSVDLQRRRDGKATPLQTLQDGDSFVLPAVGPASVSRLPPPELRGQVPRAFLDSLPRRAERFAGRTVEPARAVEVAYGEIAPWVNGEAALRSAFVSRLTPRARDAGFRNALVAEMKLHPEWQPVLFPPPPPKKPAPPAPDVATAKAAAPEPEASAAPVAASGSN